VVGIQIEMSIEYDILSIKKKSQRDLIQKAPGYTDCVKAKFFLTNSSFMPEDESERILWALALNADN
jgi:hypothetical protein